MIKEEKKKTCATPYSHPARLDVFGFRVSGLEALGLRLGVKDGLRASSTRVTFGFVFSIFAFSFVSVEVEGCVHRSPENAITITP